MDINAAFPSKFLKSTDLGGARPVVTIASVSMEEVGDDKLPVVRMVGKDKAWVINRTNASMIAEIAGTNETEHWIGVRVQLYATKTDFGGKRVDCIRCEKPAASFATAPINAPRAPLPPMPAPLPAVTTGQWSQVAAPASSFLSPADTAVAGEPMTDDEIPF